MAIKNTDKGGIIRLPKLPENIGHAFAGDMHSQIDLQIGKVLKKTQGSTDPVCVYLYLGTDSRDTATWESEENATLCVQVTSEREPGPGRAYTWILVDFVDHVLRRETGVAKSYRIHTERLYMYDERDSYIRYDTDTMEERANRALRNLVNRRKTELDLPLGYSK